jgi:hypothetical protein
MSAPRRRSSSGHDNGPAPGRPLSLLVALVAAGACSRCASSAGANGANDGDAAGRHCPTRGKSPSPIVVWPEPRATAGATTPKEIEICLNQDVDRFSLRTQIVTANEVPVTTCLTREVSMIGRAPVDWARGTVRSFSLDYPEQLPPGMYMEFGFAFVEAVVYGSLFVDRTFRSFEVTGSGIEPTDSSAVQASAASELPRAALPPCQDGTSERRWPNDELPEDDTIGTIDVDDWSEVRTLQPLRHEVIDTDESRTRYSSLNFSAWNAEGARIELHMEYLPEAGQPFEGPVQLELSEGGAGQVQGVWSARSGHAVVVDRGGEELEVQLSDVVLEAGRTIDEPPVTRALPDGSIVGRVRRRCRGPAWEDDDASWSSPYCDGVRQAAGF